MPPKKPKSTDSTLPPVPTGGLLPGEKVDFKVTPRTVLNDAAASMGLTPPAPAPVAPRLSPATTVAYNELQDDYMPILAKMDICEALLKRYGSTYTDDEGEVVQAALKFLVSVADRKGPLVDNKRDRARALTILLAYGA